MSVASALTAGSRWPLIGPTRMRPMVNSVGRGLWLLARCAIVVRAPETAANSLTPEKSGSEAGY